MSGLKKRINLRFLGDYVGLLCVLAALVGLFSALSENYFTRSTFSPLANDIPSLTVIAVGMTFVLVIGGIDLSVGSALAFGASMLGLSMVDWQCSFWEGAVLCLTVGAACGFVNGFITAQWAIPSFIVTLGMLEIARGGAYLLTDSQTKYIGETIGGVSAPTGFLGLSPAFLLALLVVVLGQLTLSKTVFGRRAIAIGANERATRLSGIDPRPVKVAVFTLSGALAGLGGLFQCSSLTTADPNAGVGLELSAIAAVVIGGTSLMGGRGSVVCSFLGVLIIAVLQNGLIHVGAQESTKRLVTGLVIVAAVVADVYRRRLARGAGGS